MNTTETKNKNISTKKTHLPKFKTIGDNLIIFSISFIVENIEKENVYNQNLIQKHSDKEMFELSPDICGLDDLTLEFLDKNIRIDMRMPKHVFDSVDYNSNDNPWEQLRNSIKEMLNIDISNAKVEELNYALFESTKVKNLFKYKIEIEGFTLKTENERRKKFVRNDEKLEYLLYGYSYSGNIVNEEIVMRKDQEFLKSYSYTDFMNCNIEDEMLKIIFKCRKNLKIQD